MLASTAIFAVFINFNLINHAGLPDNKDQSVIFSFLKQNPAINQTLLSRSNTSTLLARTDHWFSGALSSSPFSGIVLASSVTKPQTTNPTTIQDDVIVKTSPADTNNYLRHGRTEYQVVPGDSIVSIASNFGVSPQTIMIENNLGATATIRPGDKLTILATTGVSHTVKAGETIESIAAKYKVNEEDLMDVNDIELPDDILVGDVLVVPMAKVDMPTKPTSIVKDSSNKIALRVASAPADFVAAALGFIWPTTTRNITQGYSSRHTGIDISNSQMVPIYASADGFVEISGYQTGYGNTIVINHGNGYKTRYGHASELYVSAGDKVVKGQIIAKQGRSGRVRGVTGIHLHFEILKNGGRVNPLSYVKP